MENTHTQCYRVASSQCNYERKLKLESVLNLLQDALECYAQEFNFGVDFCQKQNKAWVIRNNDVRIYDLPTFDDKLLIDTTIQRMNKSTLELSSTAYMADRKRQLFSSVCQTVLVDMTTLRPVKVKENIPHVPAEESVVKVPTMPIVPLSRLDHELDKPVMWDYIDFNRHVNNAAYVIFARQALPQSFYEKNDLVRVRVAYKNSASLGDTMVVQTQREGQETLHRIVSKSDTSKEYARIQMNWRVRD